MTGKRTASSIAATLFASLAVSSLAVGALGGCGDSESSGARGGIAAIEAANDVDKTRFPQADGKKNFGMIRKEAGATPTDDTALLLAANDFVAGRVNRIPFGLFDLDHKPLWGPTVAYVAAGPSAPAVGPFEVAAHALDVPKRFRSKTSAGDYDKIGSGFYTTVINAGKRVRQVNLLTLTKVGDVTRSAITAVQLARDDPAPAPGERAPAIKTDTLADADGVVGKIDTREPPSDMHDVSLDAALGRGKPIVLIFATPALCASRVCGPVVDVAEAVKSKVGDDAVFIHQEIYRDNDVNKGFREPVLEYGLTSEPFTFVIDGKGRVTTQLQGPFTVEELEAALAAAGLRGG